MHLFIIIINVMMNSSIELKSESDLENQISNQSCLYCLGKCEEDDNICPITDDRCNDDCN